MGDRPYEVRYTFGGAAGLWGRYSSELVAEEGVRKCREHFHGLAEVVIVKDGVAAMSPSDDLTDDMALPPGKTCADCAHFKRTCEWLISYKGTETRCDWAPSRFRPKPGEQPCQAEAKS